MTTNDQELEVKYYISDLPALERRLQSLGAQLVQPRIQELNLRFDLASGELLDTGRGAAATTGHRGPPDI